MRKMQKKVLKELQTRLSSRRNRLIEAVNRRLKECTDSGGYRLPDVIDIASLASVDQLGVLVAETELKELKQIDEALARIESGSYGICGVCGNPIRRDRLKALPYATLCVKCKEEEEQYGPETQARMQDEYTDQEGTECSHRSEDIELGEYSHN